MKKFTSLILALILALSVTAGALASTPGTSGPPDFNVSSIITPDSLTVYQGEPVTFTAVTTFTSNKNDNQWLHFVSDSWVGTDASTPAAESELAVAADPAASTNERLQVFTATASVFVSDEPGEYNVYVTYTITLQHDSSGMRTYKTITISANFLIDVLEGTEDAEVTEEPPTQGGLLNHGQIVSAWAHWKKTKGNENFLAGGPGIYRSLNWYKTQVEYRAFSSVQEVYDYLDSIYEPENRHDKKDKPNKDNDNPNSKKNKP